MEAVVSGEAEGWEIRSDRAAKWRQGISIELRQKKCYSQPDLASTEVTGQFSLFFSLLAPSELAPFTKEVT